MFVRAEPGCHGHDSNATLVSTGLLSSTESKWRTVEKPVEQGPKTKKENWTENGRKSKTSFRKGRTWALRVIHTRNSRNTRAALYPSVNLRTCMVQILCARIWRVLINGSVLWDTNMYCAVCTGNKIRICLFLQKSLYILYYASSDPLTTVATKI